MKLSAPELFSKSSIFGEVMNMKFSSLEIFAIWWKDDKVKDMELSTHVNLILGDEVLKRVRERELGFRGVSAMAFPHQVFSSVDQP